MAISGGVDSMALAFLCARLRSFEPRLRVSDHPVSRFRAVIVDHGLRDGSTAEAEAVRAAVQAMGHIATVCAVNWKRYFRRWGLGNISPNSLSNVESLARKLRYRTLASELLSVKTGSLLLAHHADDQYETALMRLVSGHGVRGLRGMRPANDIPECYDMYNVYQSGFLDDQMSKYPLYNMIPTKRHRKYARAELQHEMDPEVLERELAAGLPTLDEDLDEPLRRSRAAPPLAPLDTEDGGIMIYRPLLEFSKERLVATCVENKVPWFEDHTNRDPTLTLRNALRHLYQNHELPIALQKPAILQLVARCVKRTAAEDAEADRLLSRTVIRQFVTNTGTMVVQIPQLRPCSRRSGSIYSAASIRRRREHYRTIAALLIQKLLGFVTPETQTTPISGLQTVVTRLVPTLQEEGGSSSAEPPKAFTICSVLFAPVTIKESNVIHWHLSRAPYPSRNHAELPVNWFRSLPRGARRGVRVSKWKWPEWSKWRQFDGRFWVRVRNRLPYGIALVPLQREHAKAFREALPDDASRDQLSALLRRHAPGKVRFTLPALCAVGIKDSDFKPLKWPGGEETRDDDVLEIAGDEDAGEDDIAEELEWWEEEKFFGPWDETNFQRLRVLALPTLGVHIAGLERWLQWEVRYRKVGAVLAQRDELRSAWIRKVDKTSRTDDRHRIRRRNGQRAM